MEITFSKDGKVIGKLVYTLVSDKIISIDSTFVDYDYRGQGIADKLMHELITIMQENGYTCIPICSYAISWFNKNKDYQSLIK